MGRLSPKPLYHLREGVWGMSGSHAHACNARTHTRQFHPAPFFVMDECDAALDAANVNKVSNYIKRNSQHFQSLVISLKDTFFDKADALVGVYKELSENHSKTMTLDMAGYVDNDEEHD